MSWEPSRRLPPALPPGRIRREWDLPHWRTSCEGCGAPVQGHEMQCSYCLRATAVCVPDPIAAVAAGVISINAAREMLDVTTMEDTAPRYFTRSTGCR